MISVNYDIVFQLDRLALRNLRTPTTSPRMHWTTQITNKETVQEVAKHTKRDNSLPPIQAKHTTHSHKLQPRPADRAQIPLQGG